jgi:lipoyl synthase
MNDKKQLQRRHPDWVRSRLPRTARASSVRAALSAGGLHTVCEEARCPNRGECWDAGTATFLILGDACTRGCGYCGVSRGATAPPDPGEPRRVAEAVLRMGCRYMVVTSVTRDDLPDGGAGHFATTVRTLREMAPGAKVELLVPDFQGDAEALRVVADSMPDVLGHNLEVVRRLFPELRPEGSYDRSLSFFRNLRELRPGLVAKSGIMMGLGETRGEAREALRDLREAGVRIVTVGQYLQPAPERVPVARYVPPEEFEEMRAEALAMGFAAAVCGPLVRSSYRAHEAAAEMARCVGT